MLETLIMNNSIKENYTTQVRKYTAEVEALKHKASSFVIGELLSFGGIIAFIICYFALDGDTRLWLTGAALCLAAYLTIRHFDDKNREKSEQISALLKVYENEGKALDGDFSPFETGSQYQDPQHPYAFDLDVFGKGSLYNRICRTITTGGSDVLASWLTRKTPLTIEEIERRRELIKEMSEERREESEEWRMAFLALGERNKNQVMDGYKKIDSVAVADAMQKVSLLQVPGWFGTSLSLIFGWIAIIGLLVAILLAISGIVSVNIPIWWVILQYLMVFSICKQTLDKIDAGGGKLRHQLIAYSQILNLIAQQDFKSGLGKQMQTTLADALPSFAQLEKILKAYDSRSNFLGLFITDAFLLSDFFLVRRFLKWKNTYMVKMEEWMHIISEMDALVSMADFQYNHPEATHAELVDNEAEIVFEAKNLYHPFLGTKAVKNDFTIKDSNYYIITGANMAGKSTFLRSLGVNYILAMAGMQVFADQLKVSRFRLFSSMRTTDDLTHGISYFNAELIRLEELLKFCQKSAPFRTLIILDEILKGTNSLDKLNGSRKFLEAISRQAVSGIIATHDLELSKMEEDASGKFHNYCFEIDLGTDVTYTYKIKTGVARNQNATFLLNKILEKY